MIQFTGYDLLWLFFIYSFVGWVLETAAATFMHRKFSNRGLVNGPLCILYGVGAVAMSAGYGSFYLHPCMQQLQSSSLES